jgi:hypothetical protein
MKDEITGDPIPEENWIKRDCYVLPWKWKFGNKYEGRVRKSKTDTMDGSLVDF